MGAARSEHGKRAGGARRALILAALALAARAGAQPPVDTARTFAAGPVSETAIVAALGGAHTDRFHPVGSTSVVFQVDLAGPIDAAFKPESHLHPRGWLSEVAAYRIGRELNLDDVPPAVLRSIDRGQLRRRLDPDDGVVFDELAADIVFTGQLARGSFIYWVPGLGRSDLDTPAGIERWSAWLARGGEIPAEDRELARDISNMLVFDYLIGNRDRWSGGNVRPAEGGRRLVIRDHNLAFPAVLPASAHLRMVQFLCRARRFSRQTVRRLEALDEASLRLVLETEEPRMLLDDRQIAGVLSRRETLRSYLGALVETYGEHAVLFFD